MTDSRPFGVYVGSLMPFKDSPGWISVRYPPAMPVYSLNIFGRALPANTMLLCIITSSMAHLTATGSIVQGYSKSGVNRGNVRLGRPDKTKKSTALVAAVAYTMELARVVMISCHLSMGLLMTRYVKSLGGIERLEGFAQDSGFQRGEVPWIVRQT